MRHVGELGEAVPPDVVVAPEYLRLEAIGDALVALCLEDEPADGSGPAGAGETGGMRLPGVPERRLRELRHLGQSPVAVFGDQEGSVKGGSGSGRIFDPAEVVR